MLESVKSYFRRGKHRSTPGRHRVRLGGFPALLLIAVLTEGSVA